MRGYLVDALDFQLAAQAKLRMLIGLHRDTQTERVLREVLQELRGPTETLRNLVEKAEKGGQAHG